MAISWVLSRGTDYLEVAPSPGNGAGSAFHTIIIPPSIFDTNNCLIQADSEDSTAAFEMLLKLGYVLSPV